MKLLVDLIQRSKSVYQQVSLRDQAQDRNSFRKDLNTLKSEHLIS